MDELDKLSDVPENPDAMPFPDFNPEPPARGGALKWVIALVVVGGIGAFAYFGGARTLLDWYASQPMLLQNTAKMQELKANSPLSSLTLPSSVRLIGAYHAPFKDKGVNVFLAASETDPRVLPKEFNQAVQVGAHKGSVYYLITAKESTTSLDQNLKMIGDIARKQGVVSHIQKQIWISEKAVPASVDEIVKDNQIFQLIEVNVSADTGLLAITPKAQVEQSPDRDVIAKLFQVTTPDVSITPPEPAGLKLARTVLSSDMAERKKAVTGLAALPGSQPEAVAFLADAFAKESSEVKVDIIAALGLLAPNTPQAVQPLIVALGDKPTRLEAMAALGSLGHAAEAAVPALKKMALNKKEPKAVRTAASNTIAKITGHPLASAPKSKGAKKKRRR